jgi:hypothetical protein
VDTRELLPVNDNGAAAMPRRWFSRRALWHTLGLVVALLLAWLVLRAYQQPALLIELSNWRLC